MIYRVYRWVTTKVRVQRFVSFIFILVGVTDGVHVESIHTQGEPFFYGILSMKMRNMFIML